MTPARIRPARLDDRDFILGLVPRLTEFGEVPGRDPAQLIARDAAVLTAVLERPSADAVLYVAEDEGGRPIGFIHLTTVDDYYTNSDTGHIADVVVSPDASGAGVGSALVAFAEDWARARGFALLTLHVFTQNERARALYRRLGFQEEWIRCIKRL
jgi:ribosomal protein S18 acetylase RimI-like enzyme